MWLKDEAGTYLVNSDHIYIDGRDIVAKTNNSNVILGMYSSKEVAKGILNDIFDQIIKGYKYIIVSKE